jgi:hypothetical protein
MQVGKCTWSGATVQTLRIDDAGAARDIADAVSAAAYPYALC